MANFPKGRVLVVEDDALVAKLIQSIVERQGYQVVGLASNGHKAVEAVGQLRPDVVLMDLQIPEMDGLEATRRIQETCPTPVVVLTAHDDLKLTAEAARAGVGAYLVKPPRERELARAITLARARFTEEQETRERNAELEAYDYTVAHDLKNPLSMIVGSADLLSHVLDDVEVEGSQRMLEGILEGSLRLKEIVDSLLLLTTSRDDEIEMKPLDMRQVVAQARRDLESMAQQRGAQVSVPEEWPTARGYAPWVQSVWTNYLSNALKYSGNPPHIELGANEQADGMVRFWIRDDGPGISEEKQDKLFVKLSRLDRPESLGHGLGLAIVRRIVERLGGEVGVESCLGEGSTFWFTLRAV